MKSILLLLIIPLIASGQHQPESVTHPFKKRMMVSFYSCPIFYQGPTEKPIEVVEFDNPGTSPHTLVSAHKQKEASVIVSDSTIPAIEIKVFNIGDYGSSNCIVYYFIPELDSTGTQFRYLIQCSEPPSGTHFEIILENVGWIEQILGNQTISVDQRVMNSSGWFKLPKSGAPLDVTLSYSAMANKGSAQIFQTVYLPE